MESLLTKPAVIPLPSRVCSLPFLRGSFAPGKYLCRQHNPRRFRGCLIKYRYVNPKFTAYNRSQKLGLVKATSGHSLESESEGYTPRSIWEAILASLNVLYKFSRPHTIIGTAMGIISVSLLAVKSLSDVSPLFFGGVLEAVVAALFMNVYIVGLNQLFDIEIDKVNKPDLPLASGEYSPRAGIAIVIASAILDIPDIDGDKIFGIHSFSVRLGQERVFWICIYLLEMAYMVAMVVGATSSCLWSKCITVIGHAILASILWKRAKSHEPMTKATITSFYMFVWKLFYAEYLLIPFVR